MYSVEHLAAHGYPIYMARLLFIIRGTWTNNCSKLAFCAGFYPSVFQILVERENSSAGAVIFNLISKYHHSCTCDKSNGVLTTIDVCYVLSKICLGRGGPCGHWKSDDTEIENRRNKSMFD